MPSDIKWKQVINTSFYALCVPARHTFVPDGEDLVEILTFRRERAGRIEREREDVPPSLPVPGSPVSIPPSNLSPSPLARLIFQLWQPFIKNRFQKALLPSDGIPYKSSGRNAPSSLRPRRRHRVSVTLPTVGKHPHTQSAVETRARKH